MNVLIVAFAPFPGTSRLFNQVNALREGGHRTTVLCPRSPGEARREIATGVEVLRIGVGKGRRSIVTYMFAWPAFTLLAAALATWLAIRRRFDAVQIFNQPDVLVVCGLMARARGARLILDYRDPMPETFMSKFGAGRRHPVVVLLSIIERLCLRLPDRVLTVSELYRRRLVALGVAPDRIGIFMNAPDPALFAFREPARGGRRGLVAIYHGTLARRLGADCAVEAAALARRAIPDLKLLLYGEGEMAGPLRRKIAAEGLEEVVEVRGPVPCDRVPAALREVDVGLVPMRRDVYTDTILPAKLLEYVAAGVPVLASGTEAVRRHFAEDEVFYCEPGEPEAIARGLVEAWRRPARFATSAAKARRRYEALVDRWAMVGAYLDLMEGRDVHGSR